MHSSSVGCPVCAWPAGSASLRDYRSIRRFIYTLVHFFRCAQCVQITQFVGERRQKCPRYCMAARFANINSSSDLSRFAGTKNSKFMGGSDLTKAGLPASKFENNPRRQGELLPPVCGGQFDRSEQTRRDYLIPRSPSGAVGKYVEEKGAVTALRGATACTGRIEMGGPTAPPNGILGAVLPLFWSRSSVLRCRYFG